MPVAAAGRRGHGAILAAAPGDGGGGGKTGAMVGGRDKSRGCVWQVGGVGCWYRQIGLVKAKATQCPSALPSAPACFIINPLSPRMTTTSTFPYTRPTYR